MWAGIVSRRVTSDSSDTGIHPKRGKSTTAHPKIPLAGEGATWAGIVSRRVSSDSSDTGTPMKFTQPPLTLEPNPRSKSNPNPPRYMTIFVMAGSKDT